MNMFRVTGPVGSVAAAGEADGADGADGAGWAPPVHAEMMNASVATSATGLILIDSSSPMWSDLRWLPLQPRHTSPTCPLCDRLSPLRRSGARAQRLPARMRRHLTRCPPARGRLETNRTTNAHGARIPEQAQ